MTLNKTAFITCLATTVVAGALLLSLSASFAEQTGPQPSPAEVVAEG